MSARVYQDHVAYAVATARERRVVMGAVTVSLVLVMAALVCNYWATPIPAFAALLPISMTAMATTLAITTAILRNQYRASHLPSFALLGTAYGVAAVCVAVDTLATCGLLPGSARDPQVQAELWLLWHAAFIALTAGYLRARRVVHQERYDAAGRLRFVRRYVFGVFALTFAAMAGIFAFGRYAPALVGERGTETFFFRTVLEDGLILGGVAVLVVLVVRTKLLETTHLWLAAVLVTMLLETVTLGEIARQPFSIAWVLSRIIEWYGVTLYLAAQLRHLNELLGSYAAKTDDLEEETQRDSLTSLYNRRGFDARLSNALAESSLTNEPVAMLLLDLDHFKLFNDYFGHVAGDEALRTISRAFASVANRPRDAVCRIGGEEFAIVLPATEASGALAVAERVREAVMRMKVPHAPEAPLPIVTVSIGVVAVEARDVLTATPLRMYADADAALYRSKTGGRNRISRANAASASVTNLRAI